MPAITSIIAAVGVAAGIGGSVMQMNSQKEQQKQQRRAMLLQMQEEEKRKRMMDLDAQRKRQETMREAARARATALATATAQGAEGGSSLQGAFGQIASSSNSNVQNINQQQELGGQMFDLNRQIAGANMAGNAAASQGSFGAGIASLGGALVKNSDTIGRIGNFAFG